VGEGLQKTAATATKVCRTMEERKASLKKKNSEAREEAVEWRKSLEEDGKGRGEKKIN